MKGAQVWRIPLPGLASRVAPSTLVFHQQHHSNRFLRFKSSGILSFSVWCDRMRYEKESFWASDWKHLFLFLFFQFQPVELDWTAPLSVSLVRVDAGHHALLDFKVINISLRLYALTTSFFLFITSSFQRQAKVYNLSLYKGSCSHVATLNGALRTASSIAPKPNMVTVDSYLHQNAATAHPNLFSNCPIFPTFISVSGKHILSNVQFRLDPHALTLVCLLAQWHLCRPLYYLSDWLTHSLRIAQRQRRRVSRCSPEITLLWEEDEDDDDKSNSLLHGNNIISLNWTSGGGVVLNFPCLTGHA